MNNNRYEVRLPHELICECEICRPSMPYRPIYVKKFAFNGKVFEAESVYRIGRIWYIAFTTDGRRVNEWNMSLSTWINLSTDEPDEA